MSAPHRRFVEIGTRVILDFHEPFLVVDIDPVEGTITVERRRRLAIETRALRILDLVQIDRA